MIIKIFSSLPNDAKLIRTNVFVEEQGFVEEFDSLDKISTHLVLYDNGKPVATGRFYTENNNDYYIGRLSVIKEYRGRGLGSKIIDEAERIIALKGGKAILLHSQCQAIPFYKIHGYQPFGESDFDEDRPHQWMRKNI